MARPKSKSNHVVGHYIRLPVSAEYSPIKSEALRLVSNNAKLIFLLMHHGYNGFNNGSLTASYDSFKSLYGILLSRPSFYRCIGELIAFDLVFRIYKGHKGKASRYALATYPIDDVDDLQYSPEYRPSKQPITKYRRHEKNAGNKKS